MATDTTQLLDELRGLVWRILNEDTHIPQGNAQRMAELFDALDNQIVAGRLLPRDWSKPNDERVEAMMRALNVRLRANVEFLENFLARKP